MAQKKDSKPQITFETESELHDAMEVVIKNINEDTAPDAPYKPYVIGLNQMFHFFEDLYNKNVSLLETVQEMNAVIVMNATKVQLIHQTTDLDVDNLSKLKAEYEEATRMILFAHRSEEKSKKLLTSLRANISTLSKTIMESEAFNGGDSSLFQVKQDVINITKERDNAIEESDNLSKQIETLKNETLNYTNAATNLKSESEKLTRQIEEKAKQHKQVMEERIETKDLIKHIQPIIPKLKEQVNQITEKRLALIENKEVLQNTQFQTLSQLAACRDESKKRREKISKRKRQYQELLRTSANRASRIDNLKEKSSDIDQDLAELQKEIEKENNENVDLQHQYETTYAHSEKLNAKKAEVRKQIRELRPLVIKGINDLTKIENTEKSDQRTIIAARKSLLQQTMEAQEASKVTQDIDSGVKRAKSEMKQEKSDLESMKDKIALLYQEIDDKRTDQYKTLANHDMMREKAEIAKSENASQLQELESLGQKVEHQQALSETLRSERNTYKRNYEAMIKENDEVEKQNYELEQTVVTLNRKLDQMLVDTALDHLACRRHNLEIKEESVIIEEIQQGIKKTERITSRLQAEAQTLNFILRDAKHDSLQQKKEYQLLLNNSQIVQNQLHKKDETLVELQNKVQSDQLYIQKCKELYRSKQKEICRLNNHLREINTTTQELEKRKEKIAALEYEMHRIITSTIVERHKTVTLIHEFSIPRNVHRWDAIGAVDPQFVKNLKYRGTLSSKIDAAHRELIELRQERDKLSKQLQEMQKIVEETPTMLKVHEDVQTYKDDIKRLTREIKEAEEELVITRNQMNNSAKINEKKRIKIAERKDVTALIKNEIYEATKPSSPWFITEYTGEIPPKTLGGGFVETALRNSVPSPQAIVEPTSRPVSIPKKYRSSMNDIKSPISYAQSPQVYYGKSTLLSPY